MIWPFILGCTIVCIFFMKALGRGHQGRGMTSALWLGIFLGGLWMYALLQEMPWSAGTP